MRAPPAGPACSAWCPAPACSTPARRCCTAFGCNEPVLCLTGQVPTNFLGKGRGHLHEMPDQLGDAANLREVGRPHRISRRRACAGITRLSGDAVGPTRAGRRWKCRGTCYAAHRNRAANVFDPFPAPLPDPDRVEAAAALVAGSETAMIIVGSGAIDACDEILALAELIDAPVVAFRSGRGIVSNDHELGLTMAAAYRLWPTTDLSSGSAPASNCPPRDVDDRPTPGAEIDPYRHRPVGNAPLRAACRRGRGRCRPARATCWRR